MRKTIVIVTAVLAALGIAPAAQAAHPLNVVALGDSVASGTGAGNYHEGTAGNCWRSANSYGELVAARLKATNRLNTFTNVTCSGAATADLSRPFKDRPAQLDALTVRTDLVLLTIGTNDVDYAAYGGTCIQADCTGQPTKDILAKLPAMGRNVTALLHEIKKRSPLARIFVVGYGRQVSPEENAPDTQHDPICGPGILTTEERREGNGVADRLDDTLEAAVAVARRQGVRNALYNSPFLPSGDPRPEFGGHALCESKAPFLRGFDALAPGQEGPEAVFHPNAQGQAALATLVRA